VLTWKHPEQDLTLKKLGHGKVSTKYGVSGIRIDIPALWAKDARGSDL